MLICAVGDCHGRLAALYETVARLEEQVQRQVELVVQVGDLGVWPVPCKLDRATRKHKQPGEFAGWRAAGRACPRPTLFVAGNHEDFDFLEACGSGEVLPGLRCIPSGEVVCFTVGHETLRIGGLGGCYGPSDVDKETLAGRSRRHYTRSQIRRLQEQADPGLDILLLHDAPAGPLVGLNDDRPTPRVLTSQSAGLAELVAAIAPRICLTGHIHWRTERRLDGVRTVGLSGVPFRGSALLLDFVPGVQEPSDVAEYGGVSSGTARRPIELTVDLNEHSESLRELERILRKWVDGVLQGGRRRKDVRALLYRECGKSPWFGLLKRALNGGELTTAIKRFVPREERESVVLQWKQTGLPLL